MEIESDGVGQRLDDADARRDRDRTRQGVGDSERHPEVQHGERQGLEQVSFPGVHVDSPIA
jgi:hypothetical protein